MSEMQNQTAPLQKEPVFRPFEPIFVLLSALFAFLFLKNTFAVTSGVALTATVTFFVLFTILYQVLRGAKFTLPSLIWPVVIITLSLTFTLTANETLKRWCVAFEIVAICYWVYLTFANRSAKTVDDMLGFDLIKSLFLIPFGNFSQGIRALSGRGKGRKTATLLYVLLGLGLATVPATVIFTLLLAGDSAFNRMMDSIFHNFGEVLASNFGCLFFAFPVAMLTYGLWYGSAERKFSRFLSREAKERSTKVLRFAPSTVVCAALVPILIIYVLFFISQAGYFFDAFQNLIPEGYTVAEYARDGFSNLVAVCVINGLITLVVHFFTRRTEKNGYSPVAKIFVVLFSLSSILLAVISLRKMLLYIDHYGMTENRIYASWFILLLTVLFLILILKQFLSKFNAMLAGVIACVVMFGGLCLVNVDARIAEYNVNRYIVALKEEDTSVELDFNMLYHELSDASVVAVDKSYDQLDAKEQKEADAFFENCARNLNKSLNRSKRYSEEFSFRSWNTDSARAEKVLRRRCPHLFEEGTPKAFGWSW